MKYKSVVVTKRGGPEGLEIMENDLRPPSAGEARIKILVTPVCQDDVATRVGNRPFLPKIPFVPGYSMIGVVDAIGEGVTRVAVGERVAALTNYGSYAEYLYWPEGKLVPVPTALDPAEAVTLILNYLVAYQIMHRVVQVKAGDRVLIVGASGGVGTAFLQLGKLANLTMYGLASKAKHPILAKYGAIPIDYRTQDFVQVLHEVEPDGIDYVLNGMADEYFERGLAVLRRGGAFVHYGGPQSFAGFLRLVAKLIWFNLLPNGKSIKGYGTHRVDHQILAEDWSVLFKLLEEGKIQPVIAETFPLLEAAKANALLESGQVTGNIVLLAPELL
ncbi:MAG: medium chain dehydrogenase/reductase family protein [Anaerolineae bacterium]